MEAQSLLGQLFAPALSPSLETPVAPQAPPVPEAQSVPAHPSVPEVESVPERPSVPEVKSVPEHPSVPEVESVPGHSSVPEVESVPERPSVPEVESVPENPSVSEVESVPERPSVPEVQSVPENPSVSEVESVPERPSALELESFPEHPSVPEISVPEHPSVPEVLPAAEVEPVLAEVSTLHMPKVAEVELLPELPPAAEIQSAREALSGPRTSKVSEVRVLPELPPAADQKPGLEVHFASQTPEIVRAPSELPPAARAEPVPEVLPGPQTPKFGERGAADAELAPDVVSTPQASEVAEIQRLSELPPVAETKPVQEVLLTSQMPKASGEKSPIQLPLVPETPVASQVAQVPAAGARHELPSAADVQPVAEPPPAAGAQPVYKAPPTPQAPIVPELPMDPELLPNVVTLATPKVLPLPEPKIAPELSPPFKAASTSQTSPVPEAPLVASTAGSSRELVLEPMELDDQPGAINTSAVARETLLTPAAGKPSLAPGEEITGTPRKEAPEVPEPPAVTGVVAANAGFPPGSTPPASADDSAKHYDQDSDPTIDAQADLLLQAFVNADQTPHVEASVPVPRVVQQPSAKEPPKKRTRQRTTRETGAPVGKAAAAPSAEAMMSTWQTVPPSVEQVTTPRGSLVSTVQPATRSLPSLAVEPLPISTANSAMGHQQQPRATMIPTLEQPPSTVTPQSPATEIQKQPVKWASEQATSAPTPSVTVTSAAPRAPMQPVATPGPAQPARRKSATPRAVEIPAACLPRPQPYRRPDPGIGQSNQAFPKTPVQSNPMLEPDLSATLPVGQSIMKSLRWAATNTPDSRKRAEERRPPARLDSLSQRPGIPRPNQPNVGVAGGIPSGGTGSASNSHNSGIRPVYTSGPSPVAVPLPPAYVAQPRAEEARFQRVLNPPSPPLGYFPTTPLPAPEFLQYDPAAAHKSRSKSSGAWKLPTCKPISPPALPLNDR